MYLLALALNAVLPLPNTSYAPARRTDQSFQSGTFGISAKLRAWIHGPAGSDCGGIEALKWSKRPPRFNVSRSMVQVSCMKNPRSRLTFWTAAVGPLETATAIGQGSATH